MKDKRRKEIRHRTRLRLKFGVETPTTVAYTEDISRTGLFIKSPNVVQPGKTIVMALELPDTDVVMEGMIMWAKRVPVSMIHRISKSGMAIKLMRISAGSSAYFSYVESLGASKEKQL